MILKITKILLLISIIFSLSAINNTYASDTIEVKIPINFNPVLSLCSPTKTENGDYICTVPK